MNLSEILRYKYIKNKLISCSYKNESSCIASILVCLFGKGIERLTVIMVSVTEENVNSSFWSFELVFS